MWMMRQGLSKMQKTGWMVMFVILVATTVETENARHSHGGSGKELGKPFSGDVSKYLSNLEQSISKRFEQMESRLLRSTDERISQVNHSTSITHIEKLLHHINEEIFISREQTDRSEDQVAELRRLTEVQQTEIEDLKRTVAALQKTISDLLGEQRPSEYTNQGVTTVKGIQLNHSAEESTSRPYPIDCQEVMDGEDVDSPGFYHRQVKPRQAVRPFKACCFVNQTQGAWTVIQRRMDGSIDFYRNWNDYKEGFGDVEGEFWLGNDHIYQLTNQGDYSLRIEMKTWEAEELWAEYRHFRIADEADKYRLNVSGYRGNAGNSLSSQWDNDHNGQPFSTYDNDNDERFYDNCAEHFHGAWWFRSCFQSHLNGVYYPKGTHSNFFVRNGVQWNSIHPHSSLKEVTMMIRMNRNDSRHSNGIE